MRGAMAAHAGLWGGRDLTWGAPLFWLCDEVVNQVGIREWCGGRWPCGSVSR